MYHVTVICRSSGKGSFNYRLKFQVELGPRARAFKYPHMYLQMWDRDIVYNDCIAEVRHVTMSQWSQPREAHSQALCCALSLNSRAVPSESVRV